MDENSPMSKPCSNSKKRKQRKLVTPSEAEKNKENSEVHVPRPRNAFMIFSCEWRRKYSPTYSGVSNRQVCTLLGKLWRSMTIDEKEPFFIEANRLKEEHKAKYPGYQYSPMEARAKKAARPVTLRKNGLPRKRYTSAAARKLNFSPTQEKSVVTDIKKEPCAPKTPPTEEDEDLFSLVGRSSHRWEFPLSENSALENCADSPNTVSLELNDIMAVDAMEADSFIILDEEPLGYPLSRFEESSNRLPFNIESFNHTQ